MTDQELMQQALEALTAYDGTHDYRTRYERGCYKCGSHYCPANCPEPTHLAPQQSQIQPCAGRNCGSIDPNLHSTECFEDYEKSAGMAQPVALESVYETIIHWDEGGGQRSRRELARRIVALYTTPQAQPARLPLTDGELADLWYKQSLDWMEFARAIEAHHDIKENT